MKIKEIRNWLAIYFLITTAVLGFYILLFGETPFLPIDKKSANSAFEILIPVLVGQLTLIFKWFSRNMSPQQAEEIIDIPVLLVKGPPIIVAMIMTTTIGVYVALARSTAVWKPTSETFQSIITFCVTIINATTVFIISSLFKSEN